MSAEYRQVIQSTTSRHEGVLQCDCVGYSLSRMRSESGGICDRGWRPYICRYICLWTKKNLNRTLAIDSPFQTFTVGLLVKFID